MVVLLFLHPTEWRGFKVAASPSILLLYDDTAVYLTFKLTTMPKSPSPHVMRTRRTLELLNHPIPERPGAAFRVLDFGCGAGRAVYQWRDAGFDCDGFDIRDYLSLRHPDDREFFHIGFAAQHRLPFEDASFDLVLSAQVWEHVMDPAPMLRELYRIMKPGAISLHVFPARHCLLEPHMFVPLGGIVPYHWWYLLWAQLGIRNEYQKGMCARETADANAVYFAEALNYLPTSCYEALWTKVGFLYSYFDRENLLTSSRPAFRVLGSLNNSVNWFGWCSRNFHTRRVVLKKRHITNSTCTGAPAGPS